LIETKKNNDEESKRDSKKERIKKELADTYDIDKDRSKPAIVPKPYRENQ